MKRKGSSRHITLRMVLASISSMAPLPPCSWPVVSRFGGLPDHVWDGLLLVGCWIALRGQIFASYMMMRAEHDLVSKAQVHSRDLVPFNLPVHPSCGLAATAPFRPPQVRPPSSLVDSSPFAVIM